MSKLKSKEYLFFDLDGTISDPMVGITKSVEYALNHFGIHVNDLRDLCPFIGPPLKDSFRDFYHLSDEQIEVAEEKYRERFAGIGLYENILYEGMPELLQGAREKGYKLFIATSKPTIFAEQILDYFQISREFLFVGGTDFEGSRPAKADVIRYVMEQNNITDRSKVIMIGDRKHDIIGAKTEGIESIGVLYGYGDLEELSNAGANYIVSDIPELKELLMG